MDRATLIKHRIINGLQSAVLLAVIALLLAYLAYALAGEYFLWFALTFVVTIFLLNPVIPPHMVMCMFRAERLEFSQAPELFNMTILLARRAGLDSVPALYCLPSNTLAAFAIGNRKSSAVALTRGLLKSLNPSEIAGVMGHEISHIKHNDMRVMWLAEITSRTTRFLSMAGQALLIICLPLIVFGELKVSLIPVAVLIAAPFFSLFIQLSLLRLREFHADLGSAELLGSPNPLISALNKIEYDRNGLFRTLFLGAKQSSEPWFLRSHPDTRERIRRLRKVGRNGSRTGIGKAVYHK